MAYRATGIDDNPLQVHQAGCPRLYRDVFSNIKVLWAVVTFLVVLMIALVIVICVIKGKNDICIQKSNDNASNDTKKITPLKNDPFCQLPIPRTNVHVMKCFLLYEGEYTVNCVFDTPAQVTRVCATNVTN
ncbi:uncharacterized protein LOC134705399 [Mytilus trossulus]|uniref:uncharacterized protein LOC134705399 n=1 Tax=Mytilus trossulus TaxID=6551 RepID=UPI003005FD16